MTTRTAFTLPGLLLALTSLPFQSPPPSAATVGARSSVTWDFTFPVRPGDKSPTLDEVLASARVSGRPVLLDFFAEWCAACRLLDRNTFTAREVRQEAKRFVAIRIDATDERAAEAYTKRFGVVGLPTIAFVSSRGAEAGAARLLGLVDGASLARTLRSVK